MISVNHNKEPQAAVLQQISAEQAWHYRIIPIAIDDSKVVLLTDSPSPIDIEEELEVIFGKSISLELSSKDDIQVLLSKHYRKQEGASTFNYSTHSNDFLNLLIKEAKDTSSSDIHIEVYEETCRIRIRIDGHLIERYIIEKQEYPAMINKIKIMASLDIAEKRLPQDGRIFFQEEGSKTDIRVSILPTLHGEKIVMRLLNNDATNIDINYLGLSEIEIKRYLEGIKQPNGLMLISGPTGSGKTTTLYATLKELNKVSKNIITIEDPIEYTLEGINQVQLRENIGLDFPSALRTFLRQDPDVIMVGEIRDKDTANMAIRTSLTGHLVLSTIHTNSAWGTVTRMIDMGIPSYLVANTLNTSVAQRLVRKLCEHCKTKETLKTEDLPMGFNSPKQLNHTYKACGCEKCFQTGYKGRTAIYEIIPITFKISEEIRKGTTDIRNILKKEGINTLSDNALKLLENGTTSLEEVYPLLMNS